jgi:hypothetical protein
LGVHIIISSLTFTYQEKRVLINQSISGGRRK